MHVKGHIFEEKKLNMPSKLFKKGQYEVPTKELDTFDINHPWVRERIRYFAMDTTDQILANMHEFEVSPHKSKRNYTGELERSIHWTIVNNAKGNMALVEFYYLYYGRFLELSASGWLSGPGKKYPSIGPGSVPEMQNKKGVQVGTRPWKAKPFITSQIRRNANKLLTRLAKQFAYQGGMSIFNTFVTEKSMNTMRNQGLRVDEYSEGFWEYIDEIKLAPVHLD